MSLSLGIGIRTTAVSAVLTDGERTLWARQHARQSAADLTSVLLTIGQELPPEVRGASVRVSVGPEHARARRLNGLPREAGVRVLSDAVASNLGSFFASTPGFTRGSTIVECADGAFWAAVFDDAVVQEIVSVTETMGLILDAILPAAFAVALVRLDGRFVWHDGRRAIEGLAQQGTLAEASVRTAEAPDPASLLFDDAAGAARIDLTRVPLARDAGRRAATERAHRAGASVRALWVAGLIALTAAGVIPGGVAVLQGRLTRTELQTMPGERARLVAREQDARRYAHNLVALERFRAQHVSMLRQLAWLAALVPDSARLRWAQGDSTGWQLELVAPRVGSAIDAMSAPGVTEQAALLGPIRTTSGDGPAHERAVLSLKLLSRVVRDSLPTVDDEDAP
ncbi:MAG: hypothetical protein HY275_13365 [Gemmatimonadetes bacterium]|nr:hypothetical protein [Gemmatimonadota bacterium]